MLTKMMDILAKNVLSLRRARELSQDQLAQMSGVNRSTLSTIENKAANPSLQAIIQISQALGVSLDELLSFGNREETLFVPESQLKRDVLANGKAVKTDLLPRPIPGVQFEKLTLKGHATLLGVPHLKGTWEYFTCTGGKVIVTIDGEEHSLDESDVVSFPGHKKHSYRNPSGMESRGISIVVLEGRL